MSLAQTTDRGGSAIQLIPATLVDENISNSFGTAISLEVIGECKFKWPMTGSESSDERTEVQLAHGLTLSVPKVTRKIDKAGNDVVTSGSGGGTGHSITFTCYESDYDFIVDMLGAAGDTFVVWAPLGDRNHDGFVWLLGRFDGEAEITRSGNGINGVTLTIVGKALALDSGTTAAAVITALGTAVTAITQPGIAASAPANPLSPETNITTSNAMLVAADIANPGLLAGTLIPKQGA